MVVANMDAITRTTFSQNSCTVAVNSQHVLLTQLLSLVQDNTKEKLFCTSPGHLLCCSFQGYTEGVGTDVQARLPEDPQLLELDMSEPNGSELPEAEADPFGLDALITQDKR